jgi:hypothetical protein
MLHLHLDHPVIITVVVGEVDVPGEVDVLGEVHPGDLPMARAAVWPLGALACRSWLPCNVTGASSSSRRLRARACCCHGDR